MKKFIRESECLKITGLSRPTRWRLEKANKFPKRYRISPNTVGWLESDLDNWIQSKVDGAEFPINNNKKLGRHTHGEK